MNQNPENMLSHGEYVRLIAFDRALSQIQMTAFQKPTLTKILADAEIIEKWILMGDLKQ